MTDINDITDMNDMTDINDMAQDMTDETPPDNAANIELSEAEKQEALRVIEAVLFVAAEPLDVATIAEQLPANTPVEMLIDELKQQYESRGIHIVKLGKKYAFRTAADLSYALEKHVTAKRRLSRAAQETLAIIAYHQPVTRAEIEEIRGVSISKGTIDILLDTGWVKIRGRRRVPGRPVTYGTSDHFLSHFNLESLTDLPGLEELKAIGLLDSRLPPGFTIPQTNLEELPLEDGDMGEDMLDMDMIDDRDFADHLADSDMQEMEEGQDIREDIDEVESLEKG